MLTDFHNYFCNVICYFINFTYQTAPFGGGGEVMLKMSHPLNSSIFHIYFQATGGIDYNMLSRSGEREICGDSENMNLSPVFSIGPTSWARNKISTFLLFLLAMFVLRCSIKASKAGSLGFTAFAANKKQAHTLDNMYWYFFSCH